VPTDLSKTGYLEAVEAATKDIDVQLVFCNAGYILTGFFEDRCICSFPGAHCCSLNNMAAAALF
jgi:hypothetical protein